MIVDWKYIGAAVAKSAPILGAALGGPAGAAVGSLVSAALGVDNTPEGVESALAADPSAIPRLQELQLQTEVELKRMILAAEAQQLQHQQAMYASEVSDRDSARQLAAKSPKDRIRPTITFVILFAVLFVVVAMFTGSALEVLRDPVATGTIGIVLGVLVRELNTVMAFWFGASSNPQSVGEVADQITNIIKERK